MGYACGAEQGFIYVRGEYPTARDGSRTRSGRPAPTASSALT